MAACGSRGIAAVLISLCVQCSQMAWNGINGNGDLPSQQGPMDSNADESHAVPNRYIATVLMLHMICSHAEPCCCSLSLISRMLLCPMGTPCCCVTSATLHCK